MTQSLAKRPPAINPRISIQLSPPSAVKTLDIYIITSDYGSPHPRSKFLVAWSKIKKNVHIEGPPVAWCWSEASSGEWVVAHSLMLMGWMWSPFLNGQTIRMLLLGVFPVPLTNIP